MAVTLSLALTNTATETTTTLLTAASSSVLHNSYNVSKSLTASTSQPVTKVGGGELTMSAGAGTINLAALTGVGGTVDMTGLKVQSAFFRNKSTNANPITIVVGASNGYELLGATMNIVLQPGQWIAIDGNEQTPDVASADRTIDISGTASQVLEYQIVAG